jgi:peptide/nickel transport system permease protein
MISYLSRRLSFILLVSLLIILFMHLGMRMASNSDSTAPSFDLKEQTIRAGRDAGNFIEAFISGRQVFVPRGPDLVPVVDIVREAYVNSLGLLMAALAVAAVIGISVGGFLALTNMKRLVLPILTVTLIGISTPSFVAALLLQQGELLYLRTFGERLVRMGGFGWSLEYMLLPLLVLAARPVAYLTRSTYQSLSEIMSTEYIRTAHAKGMTHQRTVNLHAMRNLAVPLLTAIGVSVRFSLASLPIVEVFFRWPGVGSALLEAISSRQTFLVVLLALSLGLTFLATNLLLDLSFRVLDPRLRDEK